MNKKLKKFDGVKKIKWTNTGHSSYFTFGKIYQLILEGTDVNRAR